MTRWVIFPVGFALILVASGSAAATHGPVQTVVEENHPFNLPPRAQAGPPVIAVDGGPGDDDGTADGDADVELWGHRTSDPNKGDEIVDRFPCLVDEIQFQTFPEFAWYRGEHENVSDEPVRAYGPDPDIDGLALGHFAFTLEAWDSCEARDLDHVHGFVASDRTELASWGFEDGVPSGWSVDGIADVTDACQVSSSGSYLAFNEGPGADGACGYASDQPVEGTATFAYDPGPTDHLALEFQTRFDIRDGVGSLPEELLGNVVEDVLTVQASFDGENWTKPNHTFQYQRLDEDLDDRWYRAGGIYNLTDRALEDGNVTFRFDFESRTAVEDGGYGWLVDDVTLSRLEE